MTAPDREIPLELFDRLAHEAQKQGKTPSELMEEAARGLLERKRRLDGSLEVRAGARLGVWNGELLKPTLRWGGALSGVMFHFQGDQHAPKTEVRRLQRLEIREQITHSRPQQARLDLLAVPHRVQTGHIRARDPLRMCALYSLCWVPWCRIP